MIAPTGLCPPNYSVITLRYNEWILSIIRVQKFGGFDPEQGSNKKKHLCAFKKEYYLTGTEIFL